MHEVPGPLEGITVLEMAGLGPVPLAGLMLAEMGARVIRIEPVVRGKPLFPLPPELDLDRHGRDILRIDLKQRDGVELMLKLADKADIIIEGFRPGVMERLEIGPEPLCKRNPRLIYGRMTGFGQDGPLAQRAGHDLTYLAYTGILNAIGHAGERPVPPLNLVGDYGGGTMFLILGLLAALFERTRSGKGQVVDAAMIDGASMLAAPLFALRAGGLWSDRQGSNLLDSGCPFYDTYPTSDGLFVAVACLEPQFFAEFARLLPLEERYVAAQYDRAVWKDMREAIAARLQEKSRDEWQAVFEGVDACVAPVLPFQEAVDHPHSVSRNLHLSGELVRPAPAPRLSRTPLTAPAAFRKRDADRILTSLGIASDKIEGLKKQGIVK